jgi:hypothetical protein
VTVSEELAALRADRDRKLAALGPRPPWWRPFARRTWRNARLRILAVSLDETTLYLRRAYSADIVSQMASRPHPMLSAMKKASGGHYVQPVRYSKD